MQQRSILGVAVADALFRTRDAWIHLVLRDDRDEAEQLSRNLCKACICGFLTASGDVLHFQIFQLIDTIWYTNIGAFFDLHFYTLTFYTYHSRLLNISCTCPRTFPCSPSIWQRTSAVRIKLPRRHSRRRKATWMVDMLTNIGRISRILRVSDSTRCFPLIKSSKLERFTLQHICNRETWWNTARCAKHMCFTLFLSYTLGPRVSGESRSNKNWWLVTSGLKRQTP